MNDKPHHRPIPDVELPEVPVPEVPPPRELNAVVRFDQVVDGFFNRLRGNAVVDRVFYTASELGDWSLLWHLLALEKGVRRGGDVDEAVRVVTLMGAESLLVNGVIKSLFRRSRPVHDAPRPHRLRQPRTSSFPSGHATAAAVFTVIAGEDSRLAPVYAGMAATVAASRIHVRIHHASDVVGGVVIGTALGFGLRRLWPTGRRWPLGIGSRSAPIGPATPCDSGPRFAVS